MAFSVNNLEGNEIADGYVRTASTAQGRWSETWGVFKGNFGKIFLINLFVLLCFTPAVVLMVMRGMFVSSYGFMYPFNANIGLGYPAYPDMSGLTESLYLQTDLIFYSLLIAAGLICSLGISGAAYSLKKLLNTHGKYKIKDFFHGIKIGYVKTALPVTLFLAFFFAAVIIGDWKDMVIAQGGSGAGPITAYVFIILATIFVGLYCAWLIAVGVSYRLKFTRLIKNSFIMLVDSPIQTVFIAGFAFIPVWIYLIGAAVSGFFSWLLTITAFIFMVLCGFSFVILSWMSFAQSRFDLYVEPEIKKETDKNKKRKQAEVPEEKDEKDIARELLAAGRSELIAKPILPIAQKVAVAPLGATFTRADFDRISSERDKLSGDISAYEKAHESEPMYAEYNRLFADREKALQPPETKKGKKKKVSRANLLNK